MNSRCETKEFSIVGVTCLLTRGLKSIGPTLMVSSLLDPDPMLSGNTSKVDSYVLDDLI